MAASHELKTPLTSLGMSIDLLHENLQSFPDEMQKDLIITAREEVLHMKSLTDDLLELSRLESGRIEIEPEKVRVNDLMEYIDTIFKHQVEQQEAELSWTVYPGGEFLFGDMNKITWVLSNLISNALRYIPLGGKIHISTVKVGYSLHISVEDNGPGIPIEFQSRIFQKFSQIRGRKSGGSGLGLAICKEIVRAHGGAIWVESQKDQGSSFTFTLPLKE